MAQSAGLVTAFVFDSSCSKTILDWTRLGVDDNRMSVNGFLYNTVLPLIEPGEQHHLAERSTVLKRQKLENPHYSWFALGTQVLRSINYSTNTQSSTQSVACSVYVGTGMSLLTIVSSFSQYLKYYLSLETTASSKCIWCIDVINAFDALMSSLQQLASQQYPNTITSPRNKKDELSNEIVAFFKKE